jgi:hypothetical protein
MREFFLQQRPPALRAAGFDKKRLSHMRQPFTV